MIFSALKFINLGLFKKASQYFDALNLAQISELCDIDFDKNQGIALYSFFSSQLLQKKLPHLHQFARSILTFNLVSILGSYAGSYYHLSRLIEGDSENISLLEQLLSLYGNPDNILTKEEAINIINSIKFLNPHNNFIKQKLKYFNFKSDLQNSTETESPKNLLLRGRIIILDKILIDLPAREKINFIKKVSYETENICCYIFIWYLLEKNELSAFHMLAAEMFLIDFNHLNGAWAVVFFHTHRAAELEPDTIEIQEKLLNLYEPGNASFDVEETKKRAQKILELKPESEPALRVLRLLDDLG